MTISSDIARVDYSSPGVSLFPVPYRFLDKTHLVVLRTVIATNVTTTLLLDNIGADGYTVAGENEPNGGAVTTVTALAAGQRLSILMDIPITQLTDYIPNDPFPAESHERALDKLTLLLKQFKENLARAVQLPPSATTGGTLPLPDPLKPLVWNAAGTALENGSTTLTGDMLLRGSLADGATAGSGAELVQVDATFNLRTWIANLLTSAGSALVGFVHALAGAVSRSVQDKLRESVSVKDFGAVGDGVTDDTAALQAAVTRAVADSFNLQFPDGTYLVSSTLTSTGVLYASAIGPRGRVIITKATAGALLTAETALITGLVFTHAGGSGHVVRLDGDDAKLTDCGFSNAGANASDMVILTRSNQEVNGCGFSNNNASAFCVSVERSAAGMCINSDVKNNTMYGIGKGVRIWSSSAGNRAEGIEISGNKIVLTGQESIQITTALHVDITSNVIDQSSLRCINLAPVTPGIDSVSIDDNYIATAAAPTSGIGIDTQNGTDAIRMLRISSNHFDLCNYGAFVGDKCSVVSIDGNTCDNINTNSIEVRDAVSASITSNAFRGASAHLVLRDGAAGGPMSVVGNSFPSTGIVSLTATDRDKFQFYGNVGKKFAGWCNFSHTTAAPGAGVFDFVVAHGLAVTPDVNRITSGIVQVSGAHSGLGVRLSAVDATNVAGRLFFTETTAGTLRVNLFVSA